MNMDNYLKHSEYVPKGKELGVGQSARAFHCKSGHGNDKLYITRSSPNTILAFCHHCGAKGKHNLKGDEGSLSMQQAIDLAEKMVTEQTYGTVSPMSNGKYEGLNYLTKDLAKWPVEARSWVFSGGLTMKEIEIYNIQWSTYLERVVIPILSSVDGSLAGYVSRRVLPEDKRPKYLLHKPDGERLHFIAPSESIKMDFTCVIVEDCMSAIKCARFVDAYAILGVNCPTRVKESLQYYHTIYIFLDNDSDIVKERQRQLKQEIEAVVDQSADVIIIEAWKDPKKHTDKELEIILTSNDRF